MPVYKRISIEKFLIDPGASNQHSSRGHMGSQGRGQATPGAHAFIRVHAWSALRFLG